MTRAEMIAWLLDMAEYFKAARGPYDTGEELHYSDYKNCLAVAEELGAMDSATGVTENQN